MIRFMNETKIFKGQKIYYARILPMVDIYDVCELIIRTIEKDYFVGIDKCDKHAYLLTYDKINKSVFFNKNDALNIVKETEKIIK